MMLSRRMPASRPAWRGVVGSSWALFSSLAAMTALVLALTASLIEAQPPCSISGMATSSRFTVVNNCTRSAVLVFHAGQTGSVEAGQWCDAFGTYNPQNGVDYYYTAIAAQASATFPVPLAGAVSGNMIFAYGCPSGSTGMGGDCIINLGSTNNHTLVEFTAGCAYGTGDPRCAANPSGSGGLAAGDSNDISAVNGFTLPVKYALTNPGPSFAYTTYSQDAGLLDLASCPREYGYNTGKLQTIGLTSADTTVYASTYAMLTNPAYKSGISMANSVTMTDPNNPAQGVKTFSISCSSPYYWLTQTTVGSPTNPTALAANAGNHVAVPPVADTLPPNTADWYGCTNTCNVWPDCVDGQTEACVCTCPGCRGAQCSKGINGNSKSPAVQYTNYVRMLKEIGYQGYTWPYDDSQGGFGIGWTGDITAGPLPEYTVTLCPNGGDPVLQNTQIWSYDAAQGKCVGGSSGSYASLYDCQKNDPTASQNYYVVPDTVLGFPSGGIPNVTFNYCVWGGGSMSGAVGPMAYETCVGKAYPFLNAGIISTYDLLLLEN